MEDLQLYELLKDAYESTTKNYNRFKKVIESTKWDNTFTAVAMAVQKRNNGIVCR